MYAWSEVCRVSHSSWEKVYSCLSLWLCVKLKVMWRECMSFYELEKALLPPISSGNISVILSSIIPNKRRRCDGAISSLVCFLLQEDYARLKFNVTA